jgi:group I intron endonuclease
MGLIVRKSGVYAVFNTVNGLLYVGSSGNIQGRWKGHLWQLRKGIHHNRHLQHAWGKYGEAAFKLTTLELAPPEKLLTVEQKWIDATKCCESKYGYNLSLFAKAPMRGRKLSPETREKLSRLKSGKPKPKGFGLLISKRLTGIKRSPETKEKIRISKLGKPAPNIGRPMSAEQKEKLSKVRRGKLLVFMPGKPHHNLIDRTALANYTAKGWIQGKQSSRLNITKPCKVCGTKFEIHRKKEIKRSCCSRPCATKAGHTSRIKTPHTNS